MALSFPIPKPRILSPRLPPKPPIAATTPPPNPILMLSSSTPSSISAATSRRSHRQRQRRLFVVKSASADGFYSQNGTGGSEPEPIRKEDKLSSFLQLLRSILPGGSWWNLSDQHVDVVVGTKPVTVWFALRRMWQLVASDRWVIFVAFSSLSLAAIAEISIPHFLTASIFSAQSAETVVFKRNVKRMRETLYSALLLQDISFFDNTTVGDLTSRLGADCQQVSRKKAAKLTQEFTASSNEVAQETFSLVRTVRVYGTEEQELDSIFPIYRSLRLYIWSFFYGSCNAGQKLSAIRGHIDFSDVSFYYPSRDTVGLSGSGKSTLVSLLLRLYEPTNGQILIDGFPLKKLDINWFREQVGFVGQEPKLFRMDVSSNIKYGCSRAVSQKEVEWAAKQAFAHDFISLLPNRYNTIVDDDLLSGGQKQRIAIARAILRDPTILILDEATSALDAESEHNVKGVLRAVRNDSQAKRSVIIIAHRLSTIQAADRIIVMDGGQVVETGNHKELLLKDGLYARLTRRQVDVVV
ncbi:hypothetical protein V2J09_003904 [Rumex salicifolius]